MTIYDISEKAGVSIATVSRVLNGSSNVSPKTKQKVLDVINECGYSPNVFARGLGLDSMNCVGILCADSSDIYLAKAVYYIEQGLRAGGYNAILACTGYSLETRKSSLEMMMKQRVDCVILVGSSFIESNDADNDYIRQAAEKVPVMLLNADFNCPNVYCVLCDDFKSTMDATIWLLEHKRKRILYLYNSHSYSAIRKLSGYRSAILMKEMELNKNYEQFFEGKRDDIDGMRDFLLSLGKKKIDFDAILCADDSLASGALKYAKVARRNIPKDLAVIGYNNSILTITCEPELTSVNNHLEDQCNQLVKSCIQVLSGVETPQKIIFSGELVERYTT
ncbi:MAG: LacI family transcriptional regulator [Lachnospiraceae bacterium]|nr:LacI family transcriptional regulator [Lachnospiraceae bacterium]